jgi:hypothetical protein
VAVLVDEQIYLDLLEHLMQVGVQVEMVDLVVVVDFTTPKLVELHLVLLSPALLVTHQMLVGVMLVVEVDKMVVQGIHFIIPVVAAVPVVLEKLVVMEQMPLVELVVLDIYFLLIFNFLLQQCHLPHMEIQEQVVQTIG